MKYLDASWFLEMIHDNNAIDQDVMPLIGFYYCWCAFHDLLSSQEVKFQKSDIAQIKVRSILPLTLSEKNDTKLVNEQFSDSGSRFSEAYLKDRYFKDFVNAFNEITLETHIFNVPNTWENYDKIALLIDKSFNDWQSGKDINKPWWKFWG